MWKSLLANDHGNWKILGDVVHRDGELNQSAAQWS
jgi:hypothetical protein